MSLPFKDIEFCERLNKHPALKKRMESILNLTENTAGDVIRADDAERRTIKSVRELGSEIMHDWANQRIASSSAQLKSEETGIEGNGKKKVAWHTTYGEIAVNEPTFRKPGKQFRPFIESAGIQNRGCSLPLQRAVVDFGSDNAFGRVPKKLEEHYGIDLAVSTVRKLTESHAEHMYDEAEEVKAIPEKAGCVLQIGEMDGSMIPIVRIDETGMDKRKNRKLEWKEARLSLAHEQGSTELKYGAVFQGTVDDAGQTLLNSAVLAGFGNQTHLHSVGDGAAWIADQVSDKFGTQASYLVDFYHVCEYLSEASKVCAENNETAWLEKQKNALKTNEYKSVLEDLIPYLESDEIEDKRVPVRACHRYLSNRTDQLDYKTAIEKDLPIGSGEIESAHRYVIQERLKLPGAWWKPENADFMLALRVLKANNEWDNYWDAKAA